MKLKQPRPPQKQNQRTNKGPIFKVTLKARPHKKIASPDLSFETRAGYPLVGLAGVDEVGRGCLAGPVVAAAVLLPSVVDWEKDVWLKEVTDSKLLSETQRERLAPQIEKWAQSFAVALCTPTEIDEHNILRASHIAMVRAIEGLSAKPGHVLVDGNIVPRTLKLAATPVIKGDLQCLSIAAAAILAKVWRDRWMKEQEAQYPSYGFGIHKGYPTPMHLQALRTHGVTPLHRRSFAPVAAVLGDLERSQNTVQGLQVKQVEPDHALKIQTEFKI